MIDFKKKNLEIKTKKDETAKLMVLANKKENNIKKRGIEPLNIQPMQYKENYELWPDVPLNQKITANDWNTFIDNISYLNEFEISNQSELELIKKELLILNGCNSIIKERTQLKKIVQGYLPSDYKWIIYSKRASWWKDDYSFTGVKFPFERWKNENIMNYRKWKLTFFDNNKNKHVTTIFGKIMERKIETQGDSISVFYFVDNPLTYIKNLDYSSVHKQPYVSLPSYSEKIENYHELYKKYNLGILIAIKSNNDDENIFLIPYTDLTPQIEYSNPGFSKFPIYGTSSWKISDIEVAYEEPVDLVAFTNWVNFVRINFQYNSEYSNMWGKDGEKEDSVIKDFLGKMNSEKEFLNLCDTNQNPISINISKSGNNFMAKWNFKGQEEEVTLYWTPSKIPDSAIPSKFFTDLFTPVEFSGTLILNEKDSSIAKKQMQLYIDNYFNLWTNKNHKIIDWKWKLLPSDFIPIETNVEKIDIVITEIKTNVNEINLTLPPKDIIIDVKWIYDLGFAKQNGHYVKEFEKNIFIIDFKEYGYNNIQEFANDYNSCDVPAEIIECRAAYYTIDPSNGIETLKEYARNLSTSINKLISTIPNTIPPKGTFDRVVDVNISGKGWYSNNHTEYSIYVDGTMIMMNIKMKYELVASVYAAAEARTIMRGEDADNKNKLQIIFKQNRRNYEN